MINTFGVKDSFKIYLYHHLTDNFLTDKKYSPNKNPKYICKQNINSCKKNKKITEIYKCGKLKKSKIETISIIPTKK